MAVVTVGGAYAVLAYVAQDAVHAQHWLTAPDMLSGLGLAETTPGPLILVLQFVGFLAGYRAPGPLSGIAGGAVASLLTLWVTFVPCFAFVFLGAPAMERLAANRGPVAAALAAVTASVVGVIANLAFWFGLHVLFTATVPLRWGPAVLEVPAPGSLDFSAAGLAALAALLLFGARRSPPGSAGGLRSPGIDPRHCTENAMNLMRMPWTAHGFAPHHRRLWSYPVSSPFSPQSCWSPRSG